MAVSYPDVIGDYIASQERFAVDGLQYVGYFERSTIAPGESATLHLFLQSTVNVPLTAQMKIEVPSTGGFFSSKKPMLNVEHTNIEIKMRPAEAGLFTIPVATTEHVKSGDHTVRLQVKVSTQDRAQRVRPKRSKSGLDDTFISNPTGLNLIGSLGANYVEKSVKKAEFPLKISGQPVETERAAKLEQSYNVISTDQNFQFFNEAVQELNARQVKLKSELEVEPIYVNLYAESVARFADVGLPMRIGEAIVMAKILTYSCQYFLASPNRRNGLLVPIWERALEAGVDTTDGLDVIRNYGFYHILKLSSAISFGILAKTLGRHLWTLAERQALGEYIAENLEAGQLIDVEFMYLPLLMAGTQICSKVRLQGENPDHTVALIRAAREARPSLFLDEDMEKADKIFDQILAKVAG